MKKVLILCPHRPNRSPSQRYRFEQYLSYLESKGFEFTYSYLLNQKEDQLFYSNGNFLAKFFILLKSIFIRINDCFRFKKFDIIFIQREATFLGTSFFETQAFKSGAKVIFDFDDSIWLEDTSPGNKKWAFIKKPQKFYANIKNAHLVIAGNAYLLDKAKAVNENSIIIPTTIDTSIHVPKPELRTNKTLIIGWSGSISTIKHFELIIPVLVQLKEKYKEKISFKILGDKNYQNNRIDITAIEWTEKTEVDILNTFDIGIMPLPDNEWANGKCGLKGLSYMACGVPSVLSAVGVNSTIVLNGENGFLISNLSEWVTVLSKLIEDEELRKKVGSKGRETVIENYSVQANKHLYFGAFTNFTFKK
jgi:glycosyltransferase involved in cell wall biosynthesis